MQEIIIWFFSSPTPIITILSLIIAFYTYRFQRKWNKRQHTKELTEWYAKYALPKFRYINYILNHIGFVDFRNMKILILKNYQKILTKHLLLRRQLKNYFPK